MTKDEEWAAFESQWQGNGGMVETPAIRSVVDYEVEFCSHLVNQQALVYFMQEGVKVDLLYTSQARAIYAFAQVEYERTRRAPSPSMLLDEFPHFDFVDPQTGYEWLVDKIRDRYRSAQVQDTTRKLAALTRDPDEAYAYLRDQVFEIERKSGSDRDTYSADDYEYFIDLYEARIAEGFMEGFSTGFKRVDIHSGGVRPGQLSFYLARPKRYKTFFLCNAFVKQRQQGKIPAFFSLEMTHLEIWGRITCLLTGLSFDDWDKGRFGEKEKKIQRNAWEDFKGLGPSYLIRPPIGERSVTALFMKADKLEAESLLIDQLSFLEASKASYSREDLKHAECVYAMKNYAGRQGSERPVICAAQFNREAASLTEMASASKAALTGAIEQAADSLYGLHRTDDMKDMNVVQFGLLESRNADPEDWMIKVELRSETRFEMDGVLNG